MHQKLYHSSCASKLSHVAASPVEELRILQTCLPKLWTCEPQDKHCLTSRLGLALSLSNQGGTSPVVPLAIVVSSMACIADSAACLAPLPFSSSPVDGASSSPLEDPLSKSSLPSCPTAVFSQVSSWDSTRTGLPLPLPWMRALLLLLLPLPLLPPFLLFLFWNVIFTGQYLHLRHMPRNDALGGGASGDGSQTDAKRAAAYSIT